MDRPLIPSNGTLLTARGAVAIYVTPDRQAEKRQYSPRKQGHKLREYSQSDPMGKSYGVTVLGADGTVYLKITMYRWVSDDLISHAREWADGYILLSEEDSTWSRRKTYWWLIAVPVVAIIAFFVVRRLKQ